MINMNEIELLEKLVSFNTIEDKNNKEILDFIEKYLSRIGFKTISKNKNLVMEFGENPVLGFLGHSDTVEYIDGWNSDPFTLTKCDGNLYGLGSCDMKGGIAAFLTALSKIDLFKLKRGIRVYITYDEEIGFSGIKELVTNNEKFPEYMLFGEPTDNIIDTSCKGLFAVKLFTKGIKVHSSTPGKGRSANSLMIKMLLELEKYYEENIKGDINNIFEVPYTTMNIGLINGGSAINSVASDCSSYIDFRVINKEHINLIENKIKELCDKYYGSFEVDIKIFPFDNDIDFIDEKNSAGFMTEASFIDNSKKIILGVGPVTAHEVDEHVSIESLSNCVEQYVEIINKVCL